MSGLIEDFFKANKDYVPSEEEKIIKDRILYGISFETTNENGKRKHIPYEEIDKVDIEYLIMENEK